MNKLSLLISVALVLVVTPIVSAVTGFLSDANSSAQVIPGETINVTLLRKNQFF